MLLAVLCVCFFTSTSSHLAGDIGRDLADFLHQTKATSTIRDILSGKTNFLSHESFSLKCSGCEAAASGMKTLVNLNLLTDDRIVKTIAATCNLFNIQDKRVCSQITEEFRDEFLTVAHRLNFNPKWLCFMIIGPSCGQPPRNFTSWNISIPGNKPKPIPLVRPNDGLPTLKVVQLSDVHIDLQYRPGSKKECDEPVCCREGKGVGDKSAGFWGSLNAQCDLPLWTFENSLQFIRDKIKPDLIFWTGDIPAHDDWNQTRADQLQHIQITADLLSQYFPHTTVYPSLGNHESAPVDSFPPPGITTDQLSNSWLNQFVQKVWSRWLPPDSLPTIGYAGYYSVQYSEKLRIISLNTQYCDRLNFWLYLNNTDPGNMLEWLVEELTSAEETGVNVIILGHIPTGRVDCLEAFSWNYYKIIDRFEGTIVGQYMAHTHQDHFSMLYSEESDHHPTGFQFIAPSLTTYTNLRPAIRVYTLDGDYPDSSYRPLNAETWLLDLDRANEKNETVWELEYDTVSAYNLTWLIPDTMQDLYERFREDRNFFERTFWKFKNHVQQPASSCDDECYKNNLCEIITGRTGDPDICRDISLFKQREFFFKNKMC